MLNTYIFCNNCGKHGHQFSQCKKPIISIGIITVRQNPEKNYRHEYLLICRKDSLGYIDFLRGKYPLYNKSYIERLINEMSNKEKKNIIENDFDTLWRNLWGEFVGVQYRGEENSAREKFDQINRGIKTNNSEYNLRSLVELSITDWMTPEWGFPKGRRNSNELDKTAALREFEEETGYSSEDIISIKNILPFEETFTGSNFRSYKHIYYLMFMKEIKDFGEFQRSEVSDIAWLSYEECLEKLRPYNLEKKEIITNINNILNKYTLIS